MIQSLRSLLQSTPAQLTAIAAATAFSVAPDATSELSLNTPGPECQIDVTRVDPFGDPAEILTDRETWAAREAVLDFIDSYGEPEPTSDDLARFLELSYDEVDSGGTSDPQYVWGIKNGVPIRLCGQTKQILLNDSALETPLSVVVRWEVPL